MACKDFVIDQRLGVVMGTATPVSPADESTGGPGRAAGGTGHERAQDTSEISGKREPVISNFAKKNAEAARVSIEGLSPRVRHWLGTDGWAVCGSTDFDLTAYRALVTCERCHRYFGPVEG